VDGSGPDAARGLGLGRGHHLPRRADDFINAQIPFYYSGSWQVANLSTKIGDAFDWVAVGSPCGDTGCSGLAGGAALVAIKYTDNPRRWRG
jgi:alpha-1,4-digalacturonate transport system substrate-binding protein